MKKLYLRFPIFLAALITLLNFTACEDGDGENISNSVRILGEWKYDSREEKVFIDGQQLPQSFVNALLEDEDLDDELLIPDGTTITFNSDNTYTASSPGEPDELGTWSLNSEENILTLNSNTDDAISFTISSLTDTNMVVDFVYEDTVDFNGANVIARLELTIYFVKQ